MNETLTYCALYLMGMVLGIVGAGGSILTTPIFVYLASYPVVIATTYSLVIVGLTAFAASVRYRRYIQYKRSLP
ncbi:MAG: TSUP family transporter, partial [Rickettsiaceae bacterium]|nr:TSUP family transporter [Rickettsiaceae bacterium]